MAADAAPNVEPEAPARSGLVLTALILAALVCNLNLGVANIALPDIGKAFDAPQSALNIVALGCTLGLAMSVLYFGAIGDRHGRKLMLSAGLVLTVLASFLSAFSSSIDMLIFARVFTGLAAGMSYPTTLALITALWGPGKTRVGAIALWSGVSGGGAVLGPVIAGFLLQQFWWGSVFLIAVPPAIAAVVMVFVLVPAHRNESTGAVDHLGGVLSVIMIATLVLGISTLPAPGKLPLALTLLGVTLVTGSLFIWRQRRAASPLFDLKIGARRLFWVPALGGMIVFGSLMGSMFIGQQFLQNVLGYDTVTAGLAIVPAAVGMMGVAPASARLLSRRGSRFTMLLGYAFVFASFVTMFAWGLASSYFLVGLAYLLVGVGAGLALTPASRSLTSSVPVLRVGMASGTTDLQRDLGGSIMQAIFGSLLAAGFAASFASQLSASGDAADVSASVTQALQASYASAAQVATQYPAYSAQIIAAAKTSFLDGANLAYLAGAAVIALGALLIVLRLPGKKKEQALLDSYAAQDAEPTP